MSRDNELAALASRFPGWEAWRGISGLYYAKRADDPAVVVHGESPEDLADEILRWEGNRD